MIWSDGSLLNKGQGSFEIQPQVAGGRVYLASAYGSGPGGGVLFALDASTGKVIWRFNTLLGADMGVQSVGLGSGGAYAMNASTGALLWKTPVGERNGTDDDGLLLLEHKIKLTAPYTILPGPLGGVLSNTQSPATR